MEKCFSSLYIGILAATILRNALIFPIRFVSVPFTSGSSLQLVLPRPPLHHTSCFSSLYIGILAATIETGNATEAAISFSSLYIGILAAT